MPALGKWVSVTILALGMCLSCTIFYTPFEDAIRLGAYEMKITDAQRQGFDSAATCLGISPAIDPATRVLIGSMMPGSWNAPPSATRIGYTLKEEHLIMIAPFYAHSQRLLNHELIHMNLGGGHPIELFSGRCGVWPSPQ